MKASRAAIKTAKAVKTVEERLAAVEEILQQLAATFAELTVALATDSAGIEKVLQQLVAAVATDKPSEQGQEAPKTRTARKEHDQNLPKARTVRKRGGRT